MLESIVEDDNPGQSFGKPTGYIGYSIFSLFSDDNNGIRVIPCEHGGFIASLSAAQHDSYSIRYKLHAF